MVELRSTKKRRAAERRKSKSRRRSDVPLSPVSIAAQDGSVAHQDLGRAIWRMERNLWADIFQMAASSKELEGKAASWLVSATLISKWLRPEAVRALLRSPFLESGRAVEGFTVFLSRSRNLLVQKTPTNHIVNSLSLEVGMLGSHSASSLLALTPKLRHLHFYTATDSPPYTELDSSIRWGYSQIFKLDEPVAKLNLDPSYSTLEHGDDEHVIRLRSFTWNSRMMDRQCHISLIRRAHETEHFAGLREVKLANFHLPSYLKKPPRREDPAAAEARMAADEAYLDAIADALGALPSLRHLAFESCSIVAEDLIRRLPRAMSLESLEIANCIELRSAQLTELLEAHGSNLRHLSLSHNQSLDLGFFPLLGRYCPNLRELRINMTFFASTRALWESGPLFDQSLEADQTPSWPRELNVLDLENIRGMSQETAEMFFQSLLDSAPNLPMLQHINLKTLLDIPWRRRAKFRQVWHARLQTVFLRPFMPPREHSSSSLGHDGASSSSSPSQNPADEDIDSSSTPSRPRKRRRAAAKPPSRQSTRIAQKPAPRPGKRRTGPGGESPRSLRAARRGNYAEPDSDEFDSDHSDDDSNEGESRKSGRRGGAGDGDVDMQDCPQPAGASRAEASTAFIQGQCNTVDLMLDNQKPTSVQYGMGDFVDSDHDDEDEEWDGNDMDFDD